MRAEEAQRTRYINDPALAMPPSMVMTVPVV
jgi:hypothetical protein